MKYGGKSKDSFCEDTTDTRDLVGQYEAGGLKVVGEKTAEKADLARTGNFALILLE